MRGVRRAGAPVFGVALAALAALPAPVPAGVPAELEVWVQGPVRWLILPAELREMRRVGTVAEAASFMERFWSRRDPDPFSPGNSYRDNFHRRVEAADLLYAEGRERGSLTDRGRALVVLGAPTGLKIGNAPELQWAPRRGKRPKARVRNVAQETWVYRLGDLPPVFAQALPEAQAAGEIRLSFVQMGRQMRLREGDAYLDLAARIALARPSD